jgi:hypothetical protein
MNRRFDKPSALNLGFPLYPGGAGESSGVAQRLMRRAQNGEWGQRFSSE